MHDLSKNQGPRRYMEDTNFARNIGGFQAYGVFDGHGGPKCARYVARALPVILARCLQEEPSPRAALRRAFLETDQNFLDRDSSLDGCTGVVALVRGTQVTVANLGDSRCVLGGRRTVVLTRDHRSSVDSERQRIEAAGGFVEDGYAFTFTSTDGLEPSRSFGDRAFKLNPLLTPEGQMISPLPEITECIIAQRDDFLVLASDGLWDVLGPSDVTSNVRRGHTADMLVNDAYLAGSTDNTTVLIVWF